MKNRLKYILIVCFGLLSEIIYGQSVSSNINSPETILFYTDKPYYLSGEVMYYKLIVTNTLNNTPTNFSNAVYIEFPGQAGDILHTKLLLKNGACSGAIELSGDLASGPYRLKAYSGNMKSLSKDIFFSKEIQIINPQQSRDTMLRAVEIYNAEKKDFPVNIIADQKSYFRREKVSADISIDSHFDAPVSFSVSVYKMDSAVDEDKSIAAQVQSAYAATPVLYRNSEPIYGVPEERYRLDDYTRFTKLEEVFREYVTGVGMGIGISNKKRLFIYDNITRMPFKQNAFVILDGYPVSDISKFMDIDPLKIKMIDVVTRKYFYGDDVYHGIVNIQSYNGDLAGYEPETISDSLFYEPLPAQRIFEQPQYNSAALKASRHPDFRSTLYWQPDIRADKNGKAHIEFYTSDLRGRFRMVVHATSASGSMGKGSATITVE